MRAKSATRHRQPGRPRNTSKDCDDLVQAALEAAGSGIAAVDAEGHLRHWNTRFFANLARAGLGGGTGETVATPCAGMDFYAAWPQLKDCQCVSQAHSGRVFELTRQRLPAGEILRLHDQTEEWQIQDEMHEAMQRSKAAREAKNVFMTQLAHEFRTPLNIVLGYSDLMLDETAAPSRAPDFVPWLEYTREAAQTLMNNLNDMVALIEAETGTGLPELTGCTLAEIAGGALEQMLETAQARGVDIDQAAWQALPDGIRIAADRVSLRRVFRLLADFCVAVAAPGETVVLGCRTRGSSRLLLDMTVGLEPARTRDTIARFHRGQPHAEIGLTGAASGYALVLSAALLKRQAGSLRLREKSDGKLEMILSLALSKSARIEAAHSG